MAEGNTGSGHDYDKFKEIIDGEFNPELQHAIARHDMKRGLLLEQLSDIVDGLAHDPGYPAIARIGFDEHRESFRDLATTILDDETDMESNLELLVDMIESDSHERVDTFNDLLGLNDTLLEPMERECIETVVFDNFGTVSTYAASIDNLAGFYESDLESDVTAFLHLLLSQYGREPHEDEESTEASELEIKKAFKDHVLDVAKIAAGVTIALTIDRFLKRRK